MRAGLLSQPEVIQTINQRFVSTTLTIFEVRNRLLPRGDELAKIVSKHWADPVSLMFFTPEGEFVTLLNPVRDFTDAHPDTDLRPGQQHTPRVENNSAVFLERVNRYFGKK